MNDHLKMVLGFLLKINLQHHSKSVEPECLWRAAVLRGFAAVSLKEYRIALQPLDPTYPLPCHAEEENVRGYHGNISTSGVMECGLD